MHTGLVGTPEEERPIGTLACGVRAEFVWPRTGLFGGLVTAVRRREVF